MTYVADRPCLLLTHDYQPIRFINVKQAIKLILSSVPKAEVVEKYKGEFIRTVSRAFDIPAVVRLLKKFNMKFKPRLTRKAIFIRDDYRCQYCGKEGNHSTLTLDHILPKSRNGKSSWTNLIAACHACNTRKGNRTPDEAGMRPKSVPKRLTAYEFIIGHLKNESRFTDIWTDYVQR